MKKVQYKRIGNDMKNLEYKIIQEKGHETT